MKKIIVVLNNLIAFILYFELNVLVIIHMC